MRRSANLSKRVGPCRARQVGRHMLRISFRSGWVLLAGLAGIAVGVACAGGEDVGGVATTPPPPGEDTDPGSEISIPPDEDTGDPGADTTPAEDTAAPPLTYPAGPYGKAVGSVVPNLKWMGYRDGTGAWGEIALLDYYDPDGSRGITAIKVNLAAVW